MTRLDEFALIRKLTSNKQSKALLEEKGVVVGIGDDAAVGKITTGYQLVMSCDTMVEGVHFHHWTMKAEDIGYKALVSNISDIIAMGGTPKYALISICVPKKMSDFRLKRIYSGIYSCAKRYHVAIVGGDTTSAAREFSISITIIGEVESNRALLRSSAQPGDCLFVTGELGGSAAGLNYLMDRKQIPRHDDQMPMDIKSLVEAHQRPVPSILAGRILQFSGVCHALNDISDGLASESWEIAEASDVSIIIYEDKLPIAQELLSYANHLQRDPLEWVLYGGEDYVLLGTLESGQCAMMKNLFQEKGLHFFVIGKVGLPRTNSVCILDRDGKERSLEKKGYRHF